MEPEVTNARGAALGPNERTVSRQGWFRQRLFAGILLLIKAWFSRRLLYKNHFSLTATAVLVRTAAEPHHAETMPDNDAVVANTTEPIEPTTLWRLTLSITGRGPHNRTCRVQTNYAARGPVDAHVSCQLVHQI